MNKQRDEMLRRILSPYDKSMLITTANEKLKADLGIYDLGTGELKVNPSGFSPGEIPYLVQQLEDNFPDGVWLGCARTGNQFEVKSLVLCVTENDPATPLKRYHPNPNKVYEFPEETPQKDGIEIIVSHPTIEDSVGHPISGQKSPF